MVSGDYPARRIVTRSRRPFADALATLERLVPTAKLDQFTRLVERRASASEVERHVDAMVGELGFLVLAQLDQGPLTSLLGRAKKMTVLLIGNPVLANRMFERDPGTGL